ncbi:MAG: hypothetical protein HOP13_06270, partial [Alphaproteobacteria bacterium]|nr:hypothetical protein [Alphaproteobacteria bacterium]
LSSRRGRFDAEIWLRRDGDPREMTDIEADDQLGFKCDAVGCVVQIRGHPENTVTVAWSREASLDDCAATAILIDLTRGWQPPCDAAMLNVTRRFLDTEGAIAASVTGSSVEWTSVARERGDRPWSKTQ